jgi:hypothetical protein
LASGSCFRRFRSKGRIGRWRTRDVPGLAPPLQPSSPDVREVGVAVDAGLGGGVTALAVPGGVARVGLAVAVGRRVRSSPEIGVRVGKGVALGFRVRRTWIVPEASPR